VRAPGSAPTEQLLQFGQVFLGRRLLAPEAEARPGGGSGGGDRRRAADDAEAPRIAAKGSWRDRVRANKEAREAGWLGIKHAPLSERQGDSVSSLSGLLANNYLGRQL